MVARFGSDSVLSRPSGPTERKEDVRDGSRTWVLDCDCCGCCGLDDGLDVS